MEKMFRTFPTSDGPMIINCALIRAARQERSGNTRIYFEDTHSIVVSMGLEAVEAALGSFGI